MLRLMETHPAPARRARGDGPPSTAILRAWEDGAAHPPAAGGGPAAGVPAGLGRASGAGADLGRRTAGPAGSSRGGSASRSPPLQGRDLEQQPAQQAGSRRERAPAPARRRRPPASARKLRRKQAGVDEQHQIVELRDDQGVAPPELTRRPPLALFALEGVGDVGHGCSTGAGTQAQQGAGCDRHAEPQARTRVHVLEERYRYARSPRYLV